MKQIEKLEPQDQIWRVPRKEVARKFSILTPPVLTHTNKEEWYTDRRKEQVERRARDSKIF